MYNLDHPNSLSVRCLIQQSSVMTRDVKDIPDPPTITGMLDTLLSTTKLSSSPVRIIEASKEVLFSLVMGLARAANLPALPLQAG